MFSFLIKNFIQKEDKKMEENEILEVELTEEMETEFTDGRGEVDE